MAKYEKRIKNQAIVLLVKSGMTFHAVAKVVRQGEKRNVKRVFLRDQDKYNPKEQLYDPKGYSK